MQIGGCCVVIVRGDVVYDRSCKNTVCFLGWS